MKCNCKRNKKYIFLYNISRRYARYILKLLIFIILVVFTQLTATHRVNIQKYNTY